MLFAAERMIVQRKMAEEVVAESPMNCINVEADGSYAVLSRAGLLKSRSTSAKESSDYSALNQQ